MSGETIPTRAVPERAGRTATRRALTVAGATAAALVLWALTGPVAGIGLSVRLDGAVQPVGPAAVATASLLAGLAGWALLALLERILKRPGRTWTVIAAVVLALSLAGPLGAVDTASTVVLAGMHLIVAAVLIPGLGRSVRGT
ncbi:MULTISPECIES: DUF6069 family protein [Streptosporangium]|uniref:Lysylphosphatidylglycerol synthetase-like protein (DUF2156 family) n=1 Tax=Streptosporangium brasiliense TaxID=47480 RepID=A0ABT9RBW7_9ACTN|nr:DUF6069 family protein [Streptosporangium brasiliense]MDP9866745.1 lysylphosphatidylglycerol synthetase-like protein (DUF2156 family) [Streptosporangium brasiliense]